MYSNYFSSVPAVSFSFPVGVRVPCSDSRSPAIRVLNQRPGCDICVRFMREKEPGVLPLEAMSFAGVDSVRPILSPKPKHMWGTGWSRFTRGNRHLRRLGTRGQRCTVIGGICSRISEVRHQPITCSSDISQPRPSSEGRWSLWVPGTPPLARFHICLSKTGASRFERQRLQYLKTKRQIDR